MKKFEEIIPLEINIEEYFPHYPKEKILFFDIETTGLSAKFNYIYMIGYFKIHHNNIILTQLLIEEKSEEKDLLLSFVKDMENQELYIHFNGNSFDIPFINNRLEKYDLHDSKLNKNKSFDLFQWTKSNRKDLKLINYKLKTIERFLGIYRKDLFNGGELIKKYEEYILKKDKEIENMLLLHNAEDLIYLIKILKIIDKKQYDAIKEELFYDMNYKEVIDKERLIINAFIPHIHRESFCFNFNLCEMRWNNEKKLFILQAVILKEKMLHFFLDYKNYYYIPSKDEAIHQSIAKYLDYPDKELAKASNCYIKKEGFFIENMLSSYIFPLCRKDYLDKTLYIPLEFEKEKQKLTENFIKKLLYEIIKPE